MMSDLSRTEEIFLKTPIPLSQELFSLHQGESLPSACEKLSGFASELLQSYAEGIRPNIQAYYDGINSDDSDKVFGTPDIIDSPFLANWILYASDDSFWFNVFFDSRICECDLLVNFLAIHEITVHVGQSIDRIGRIGVKNFRDEFNSDDFQIFTEMSAALVEHVLHQGIPFDYFEKDIENAADDQAKEDVLIGLLKEREVSLQDRVSLESRKSICDLDGTVTKEHWDLFLGRPDVKAVLRLLESQKILNNKPNNFGLN